MSKTPSGPENLAESAFYALNKSGCEDICKRWKNMEELHSKSAAEASDEDQVRYFESMAAPYREAREHLEKLIRRKK